MKTQLTVLLILSMSACLSPKSEKMKMEELAGQYTAAWNSQTPEKVASFFAEDGALIVNEGSALTGRAEITKFAGEFMTSFPDMKLSLDSLVEDSGTFRYHWTFEGHNTGPEGTGNKVVFSGFERWTLNDQGLIQTSIGTYDAEDYSKQANEIK